MRKIRMRVRGEDGPYEIREIEGELSAGWKDKNGREIFEGDTVIVDFFGEKYESITKWNAAQCRITAEHTYDDKQGFPHTLYFLVGSDIDDDDAPYEDSGLDDIEVIE